MPSTETIADVHQINDLTTGRKLYIQNCGGCHNLFVPDKFADEHWIAEMQEMKTEAKITDGEAELILKYLTADLKVSN